MLKHFNKGQSILCVAIIVLGFMAGGHIAGHIMFGILMFVGLIALVENVSWIRWIVYKSNVFLDIFFFSASIGATIYMGVTITGAITVASIIFSLVYAPYIRNSMKSKETKDLVDRGTQARYKRG